MNTRATKSQTKFMVELTPKELYVIQCSLEQFRGIDDSEFRKITKIAEKLLVRLPDAGIEWSDVSA
jgi:hypothetical protein